MVRGFFHSLRGALPGLAVFALTTKPEISNIFWLVGTLASWSITEHLDKDPSFKKMLDEMMIPSPVQPGEGPTGEASTKADRKDHSDPGVE